MGGKPKIFTPFASTRAKRGIILISNPGAEIATRACLAARVAANCEAGRYGETWLWLRWRSHVHPPTVVLCVVPDEFLLIFRRYPSTYYLTINTQWCILRFSRSSSSVCEYLIYYDCSSTKETEKGSLRRGPCASRQEASTWHPAHPNSCGKLLAQPEWRCYWWCDYSYTTMISLLDFYSPHRHPKVPSLVMTKRAIISSSRYQMTWSIAAVSFIVPSLLRL